MIYDILRWTIKCFCLKLSILKDSSSSSFLPSVLFFHKCWWVVVWNNAVFGPVSFLQKKKKQQQHTIAPLRDMLMIHWIPYLVSKNKNIVLNFCFFSVGQHFFSPPLFPLNNGGRQDSRFIYPSHINLNFSSYFFFSFCKIPWPIFTPLKVILSKRPKSFTLIKVKFFKPQKKRKLKTKK